jgi:putative ABC transport system permease protein
VYIFASIALAILLIAAINYMTLATARSERRSREVGVRKVVGARRSQLAGQFLGESVLFCILAAVLALGLIYYALPFFRDLVGRDLDPLHLLNASTGIFLLVLVLLTGLLSGTYPAVLL